MANKALRVGDRVKSRYRAPWLGIVTAIVLRKGIGALVSVVIDTDRHGNPMRKHKTVQLDETWLLVV